MVGMPPMLPPEKHPQEAIQLLQPRSCQAQVTFTGFQASGDTEAAQRMPQINMSLGKPGTEETLERYDGIEQFLKARRLVEAGAGCVSLSVGTWDTHKEWN